MIGKIPNIFELAELQKGVMNGNPEDFLKSKMKQIEDNTPLLSIIDKLSR